MNKTWCKGALLIIIGGCAWAVSGVTAQYLIENCGVTTPWLIPYRLFFAGTIMLLISKLSGHKIMGVWKSRKNLEPMFLYGLVGLALCQFSFFFTIQNSNAAFATVMSYTTPVFLIIWNLFRYLKKPNLFEVISVILVLAGAFTCVTHCDLSTFAVSPTAVIWSLICAAAFAFYIMVPKQMILEYDVLSVTGWGMLVGAAAAMIIFHPWTIKGVQYNRKLWIGMIIIILIGTVFSFSMFQFGNKIVGGLPASVLSAVEPVASVCLSSMLLHVSFTVYDIIGFTMIILTIPIVAYSQNRKPRS